MVALNDRSTGVIYFSGKLYVQGPVPSCNLKLAPSLCPNSTCDLGIMVDSAETMLNHV